MAKFPQEESDRIKEWFVNHKLSQRQSISWHMASRDEHGRDESNYAYSVTWTPGTLCMAGDLGEFTVTHYQAMRTIEGTLRWLDGIDFFYLMGKSTGKREYDAEATLTDIVRMANEDAIKSRWDLIEQRREYRASLVDDPDPDGKYAPPPLKIEERAYVSYGCSPDRWVVPEGWDLWHRIWNEVEGCGDPNQIFKPEGRWYLKERLRDQLYDAGVAAQTCRDIGLDDYYGRHEYPFFCHVWQIAIQEWVAVVKPQYAAREAAT